MSEKCTRCEVHIPMQFQLSASNWNFILMQSNVYPTSLNQKVFSVELGLFREVDCKFTFGRHPLSRILFEV